jgi:hypothetical protein
VIDFYFGSPGSVSLTDYVTGNGTDETAGLQRAVTRALATGVPLVGAPITVRTSSTIDMRGNGLIVNGNNMRIRRTNFTGPVVQIGGNNQQINSLAVDFTSQATVGQTLANGFEWYNMYESSYDNLSADLCNRSHFLAQAGWQGAPSNTVFSCTFTNFYCNGWTDVAFDLQTWPAGGASSTGNVFANFYLHNNYAGGAGVACNGYFRMQDHDEGNFTQVNCEWGIPAGDLLFLQRCKNMNWISMHFEGIQLSSASGDIALLHCYETGIHTVQGLTFTNSTILNSANNKTMFKTTQGGTNPMMLDITGMAVRSLTNASVNQVGVVNVLAGGGGSTTYGEFKNVTDPAVGGLSGTQIVGDATGTQIRRLNRDYRGGLAQTKPAVTGSKGANAALTSLMTTLAALGIVTDSTT